MIVIFSHFKRIAIDTRVFFHEMTDTDVELRCAALFFIFFNELLFSFLLAHSVLTLMCVNSLLNTAASKTRIEQK